MRDHPENQSLNPMHGAREPVEPPDIAELDDLMGYHLRRAQSLLFGHFRDEFQDRGITPGQVGLMCLIRNNPGISQTALARSHRIERATLGETLNYLEVRGWIARHASPHDRRVKALHLTEKGNDFLRRLLPSIRRHEQQVSGNLSDREFQELLRLLRKFVDGTGA